MEGGEEHLLITYYVTELSILQTLSHLILIITLGLKKYTFPPTPHLQVLHKVKDMKPLANNKTLNKCKLSLLNHFSWWVSLVGDHSHHKT